MNYNILSKDSIISYAKKLQGRTLKESCQNLINKDEISGKGGTRIWFGARHF